MFAVAGLGFRLFSPLEHRQLPWWTPGSRRGRSVDRRRCAGMLRASRCCCCRRTGSVVSRVDRAWIISRCGGGRAGERRPGILLPCECDRGADNGMSVVIRTVCGRGTLGRRSEYAAGACFQIHPTWGSHTEHPTVTVESRSCFLNFSQSRPNVRGRRITASSPPSPSRAPQRHSVPAEIGLQTPSCRGSN